VSLDYQNQMGLIVTVLKFKAAEESEAVKNVNLLIEMRNEHNIKDSLVKYSELLVVQEPGCLYDFLVVAKKLPRFSLVEAFKNEFP
jgi:hypothetical protein